MDQRTIGMDQREIHHLRTCPDDVVVVQEYPGTPGLPLGEHTSPCTMGRGSPRGLREDGTTIPLVPVHAKKTIISWWSLLCHAMARHPLGDDMPCGWLEYSVRVSPSFPSPLHPLVYP